MAMTIPHAAALAGVPSGVQAQGPWAGRRQLFVRFAGEAETATMYTAAALAGELRKLSTRSVYHSICVGGRDVLGNADFLAAALNEWPPPMPVMLDVDGQRPDELRTLEGKFVLVQVTHEFTGAPGLLDRTLETLRTAAALAAVHALVLAPGDDTTDGQVMRAVEGAHAASGGTIIVVHPPPSADATMLDRRWGTLLEQATRLHADVRLAVRIPPPVGLR
jgi:hypothetical protein